jgi:hypothetical protein
VRGAAKLAATLRGNRSDALLFKTIATVVTDVSDDVRIGSVDDWEWHGPSRDLQRFSRELDMTDLVERAERAMVGR